MIFGLTHACHCLPDGMEETTPAQQAEEEGKPSLLLATFHDEGARMSCGTSLSRLSQSGLAEAANNVSILGPDCAMCAASVNDVLCSPVLGLRDFAQVVHSQQATPSMRAAAPPMSQRPKLEEKQAGWSVPLRMSCSSPDASGRKIRLARAPYNPSSRRIFLRR